MNKRTFTNKFLVAISVAAIINFTFPVVLSASETDGTIDSSEKYARFLSADTLINFATSEGDVHVTDDGLTGYAWSEDYGWINLDPGESGVSNDGEGNLSGYAWGENIGWINFAPSEGGVTIDENGEFNGYAWSENIGWIVFSCETDNSCSSLNHGVATDWRPESVRSSGSSESSFAPSPDEGGDEDVDSEDNEDEPEESVPSEEESPVDESPEDTPEVETDEDDEEPDEDIPSEVEEGDDKDPDDEVSDSGVEAGDEEGGGTSRGTTIADRVGEAITLIRKTSDNVRKSMVGLGESIQRNVSEAFEDAVVTTTASTVSVAGAVTGTATVVSSFFLTPVSFSEIVFIPLRIWTLFLSIFGFKHNRRPWGTVYDSVTKQPLDPAYVVLQDEDGKEVSGSITDLDGRYGFLQDPGKYRLVSKKTNYNFPSKRLEGKTGDILYDNLYFGENFLTEEGSVIDKNIPMDPEGFDWNEFAKRAEKGRMKFYSRFDALFTYGANILFYVGLFASLAALIAVPSLLQLGIVLFYILVFALRTFGLKPKHLGSVVDKETGQPLSFAIVRVIIPSSDQEVKRVVCDKFGRFYSLVYPGTYVIAVEKKVGEDSYERVYTSEPKEVKGGVINSSLKV
ncbi:MAG: carboxypeptidase-like regulatory domain-containing protein [Candidatus Campbellbacteria bacterium]|nr:carboxypeptidase-like regulatory domain-containing protein [Candidatus Campbellbacteria bacterium]